MPGLLGKKIGMTSVFSADGKNVPCTVIEAGPCVVTQVKSVEHDGYEAVQLGFQEAKEKNTTKPMEGHFKKAGTTPKRHLAEFTDFDKELSLGDTVTVDLFADARFVDQDDRLRKPGSIGACSYPAKVFKGMRMGGQMGNARVTTHNLQILKVIPESNLLLLKGSVPGCKGSILIIKK